jgi:hypothetical protein
MAHIAAKLNKANKPESVQATAIARRFTCSLSAIPTERVRIRGMERTKTLLSPFSPTRVAYPCFNSPVELVLRDEYIGTMNPATMMQTLYSEAIRSALTNCYAPSNFG